MKKYRYLEFVDGKMFENSFPKSNGQLFLVAENPETYAEELSLIKDKTYYSTTLENIGKLGWELVSVTPCGCFCFNQGKINMLYNAYVFKKEIEE